MTLAILGALLAPPPAAHRPPTIPALREWRAAPGAFELRAVEPHRGGRRGGGPAGARAEARRSSPAPRPRRATSSCASARPTVAWARGLPPRRGRDAADRGAHRGRRLLRHADACSSCCAGRRPIPAGRRPRLAALPRARPDDRQRPALLHPRLDQARDPAARVPEAQPAAPALLRERGLSDREREPPGGRVATSTSRSARCARSSSSPAATTSG